MPSNKSRFCLVLIKPSHYDDDGYVIQWLRSAIPSNSLAVLYGLALECAGQRVLGDNVDLEIHALDETNTRIRTDRIAASRGSCALPPEIRRACAPAGGLHHRGRPDRARRRAVKSISAGAGHRSPIAPARHHGGDRRISRFRNDCDVIRTRRRRATRGRNGRFTFRGRS